MVASKVIGIDQEVWAELQRRAVPFADSPNTVLRRILGLRPDGVAESNGSGAVELDSRVAKLLHLVEARIDEPPATSPTKTGQSYGFKSQRGKVVAFIYAQKRRLKVESSEQMAKLVGVDVWDHWLQHGWWHQDNSVYWHVPNDDDDVYEKVACVLGRLWRQ